MARTVEGLVVKVGVETVTVTRQQFESWMERLNKVQTDGATSSRRLEKVLEEMDTYSRLDRALKSEGTDGD